MKSISSTTIILTILIIVVTSVCANDYCNITACDAVEICRKEIKEKRIVDNEEHTDTMLIKLERRLRSLEQPGK